VLQCARAAFAARLFFEEMSDTGVAMFPWNPSQWTEEYLRFLIDQKEEESRILEFKSGKDLDDKKNKDTFIEKHLSKTLSAFANSEGGIFVIGMDEVEDKATKRRYAGHLDGMVIGPGHAIESLQQFQQIRDACISPFLPGMKVKRVPLSGDVQGRDALVIYVPQGTTAYQAKDRRYYSRSEFESTPMPDHEVRLRMQRGRTPQACLELGSGLRITKDQELQRRLKNKAEMEVGLFIPRRRTGSSREELAEVALPKQGFDKLEFNFAVVNTGELTIRDFALVLRAVNRDERLVLLDKRNRRVDAETRFRFLRAAELETRDLMGKNKTIQCKPEEKLFPGDRIDFPDQEWSLYVPSTSTLEADKLLAEWTIFLDDTIPYRGVIDLGVELQKKRGSRHP